MSVENVSDPHDTPIVVEEDDLPVYCPGPKAPLWSMHPRIYLPIEQSGRISCPYCSATYELKGAAKEGS